MTDPITPPAVTIRLARPTDADALARLAALDSSVVPVGTVVVAQIGDELWAAVGVESGATIADPFRRSAQAAELLGARAAQLRATPRRSIRLARRRRRVFAAEI